MVSISSIRTNNVVRYGGAASTIIAGILHLVIASNAPGLAQEGGELAALPVLFGIGGVGQILYAIPLIRKSGRPWYYAGIMVTAILIILWIGVRGYTDVLPIDVMGIAVLIFDFATLLLSIRILQTASTPSK